MMMMSDGALSQAEIDALLSGGEMPSAGGSAPAAVASGSSFPEDKQKVLESFFNETQNAQSSNLTKWAGANIALSALQITINGRDNFLAQLPEMVTVIKADFNSGFPGEHMFILPEDCAKAIVGIMTKDDNAALDEMGMSIISDAISLLIGHQITVLTGKTGNKAIASIPPEAANVPKGVVALPSGDFVGVAFQLDLGGGKTYEIWEVLGPAVALDIAASLLSGPKAASSQAGAGMQNAPTGGGMNAMNMGGMPMGGMNMGGMNMGGMNMGGMNMGGMNMGGMGMGGMPMGGMNMGNMQMGGMGGMGMGGMPFGQTNVQSVQFPNLMPHGGPQESGNISLIMDVFMEMTVELGRTRKLIKEILAMGEGTIIELDKLAGEPVDILVNHKLIAKGEVVVIDENFGVRVTEIVSPAERMNNLD